MRKTILTTNSAKHFGIPAGEMQIGRFPGGEVSLSIKEDLRDSDVFLIGSTNAPAENLVELLLAVDTINRLQANSINVVIPYFGYSRADREKFLGDAVSANVMTKIFDAISKEKLKIYSLDIHSSRIKIFFKSQFLNIDTSELFVDKFLGLKNLTVVAPDKGAEERAKTLAGKINSGSAVINKERTQTGGVVIKDIEGKVAEKALIFDDIIDSGGTILKAAELLKKLGVNEIYVAATHMVWRGGGYKLLSESQNINKVFTTDTIAPPAWVPEKIEIISVTPVLKKIFNEKRMSLS